MASPTNATQKYLYKTKLGGGGKLKWLPLPYCREHILMRFLRTAYLHVILTPTSTVPPDYRVDENDNVNPFTMEGSITNQLGRIQPPKNKVEFFKIKTEDGIELDGWMKKPDNFDQTKKYPVVFYVYGEPAGKL